MELIEGLLTIIQQVEWLPGRIMTFPVDEVLEQGGVKSSINLGVIDTVNIPASLTIFGNDWFSGFLVLAGQRVLSDMAEEAGIEDWMNFYRLGKFQLDDKGIWEYAFDRKGSYVAVV